jgi:hypothetical protein
VPTLKLEMVNWYGEEEAVPLVDLVPLKVMPLFEEVEVVLVVEETELDEVVEEVVVEVSRMLSVATVCVNSELSVWYGFDPPRLSMYM